MIDDEKLTQKMTTFNQQNEVQKKATVEMVLATLSQNMDALKNMAEQVRPIYTLAKSMPSTDFERQLGVWCDGDDEKFEATMKMIWLIDQWELLE